MTRFFLIACTACALSTSSAVGQAVVESRANSIATERNEVTFASDVALIIYEKCANCHRPGQVGPFSLLSLEDVRRHASTIAAVIDDGYMPPWKPVNEQVEYSNDRSLTKAQKEKLLAWVAAGTPSGNLSEAPALPQFADGWSLGKPDLVVKMNGSYEIPAEGRDIYRSFVFPLDLPEEKWIKAVELRSTAKGAMHHALFFLDLEHSARKLDGSDGKAGIAGMGFLGDVGGGLPDRARAAGRGLLSRFRQQQPSEPTSNQARIDGALERGLGGYVPGAIPTRLPGDLAMHLPQGADIVMQTHFHPSGKPEVEQAELALYFTDKAPSKRLVPIQVPVMFGFGAGIDIPAGEKNYRIFDSFTLPIDVQAISVGGHAHYICKTMQMTARKPDGSVIELMKIDDWDLDWQDRYLFKEPISLPAGTILETEIVYDNSADNPENPYQPPQRIRWGRESNDEMGSVTLQVVAENEAQRPELQAALRQQFNRSIVSRMIQRKGFSTLIIQLDSNRDGLLQRSEAPPRLSGQVFDSLDSDQNGGLDKKELVKLGELVESIGKNLKTEK
jgi:hypothetical protein